MKKALLLLFLFLIACGSGPTILESTGIKECFRSESNPPSRVGMGVLCESIKDCQDMEKKEDPEHVFDGDFSCQDTKYVNIELNGEEITCTISEDCWTKVTGAPKEMIPDYVQEAWNNVYNCVNSKCTITEGYSTYLNQFS